MNQPPSEYVKIRRTSLEKIMALAKQLENMDLVEGQPSLAEGYARALGRAEAMGFEIRIHAELALKEKR